MKEYQKCSMELLEFIRKSPTCFHAVENVGRMLSEAGFVQLQELSLIHISEPTRPY